MNKLAPRYNIYLKESLVFLLFLSALYFTYWPATHSYYIRHDDFHYLAYKRGNLVKHPLFEGVFVGGRFIGAYLLGIFGLFLKNVNDANYVRLACLLFISLVGFHFYCLMKKYLNDSVCALLFAFLIFTLPAFQVLIAWMSAAYSTIAIVLSVLAFMSTEKAIELFKNHRFKAFVLIFLAALCMISALATHQTMAMYYWVLVMVMVLAYSQKSIVDLMRSLMFFCITGFGALAMYWGILKIMQPFEHVRSLTYNPYTLNTHYLDQIIWFILEPLINSLNLWNIFPNFKLGISVGIFIIGIAFIVAIKRILSDTKNFLQVFFYLMVFFCLIILSFLPNLLAATHAAFYRCTVALAPMILIFLLWGILQILSFIPNETVRKNVLRFILISTCLFASVSAYKNVQEYFVLPGYTELTYIKNILQEKGIRNYDYILVVKPNPEYINKNTRYDEFGALTTNHVYDIGRMLQCAVFELGLGNEMKRFSNGKIYYGFTRDQLPSTQKILVIDVNEKFK